MLPTPADAIALFARTQPTKIAATELVSGETWTYAALDDAVSRLANHLLRSGCKPGDRVAVLSRNSVRQVMLHFACGRTGMIYVPLNWRLSAVELSELIAIAGPALLLCDEQSAPLLQDHPRVNSLPEFVSASAATPRLTDNPLPEQLRHPDRPSLILFTSGTSGRAKGVLLSERHLQHAATNFAMLTAVGSESCFLCEAPMFHTIGLVANIRPVLQQGGSILVSDGFQPQRTLNWLCDRSLKISHYTGVPQMVESFRKQPDFDPIPLRQMTAIVTGGAPHATNDIAAWLDDGVVMVSGFGMSEAGTVFGTPPDINLIRNKLGSVGISAPGLQIRLVDNSGNDCQPGEAGELWLRGDSLMLGYWRDEQNTRDVFAEGNWFKTGDIVRCDEEGFFWIVDRKKDMFISGGENVYPAEIEALLSGYPGIKEAAVVGIPNEQWGEVGCLVAVLDAGKSFDEAGLIDYLKQHLAGYKVPKSVVIMEELPRTSTGKLQKRQLKDRLCRLSR
ncbi:MAG: AMP-binding protein [Exilibacterium sp.]